MDFTKNDSYSFNIPGQRAIPVQHPHLLHIFSPTKFVSPFDINMAYEAKFDGVIPYCNVRLEEIHALTQDTIFSRSPEGGRQTGIFIGGRDFNLAIEMLDAARSAMVPPFEVSVMADPSGAITTAAAMVALAERCLKREYSDELTGRRVCVFGGTGPVGACVALLAARGGAHCAIVSHQGREAAQRTADRLADKYEIALDSADGSSSEAIRVWLPEVEVLFSAAKAGIQVINGASLKHAVSLRVIADANAVPPSGVEGVDANDSAKRIVTVNEAAAFAFGALAIGDVKFKVHTALLKQMHGAVEPMYLAYDEALATARDLVAGN